MKFSASTCIFTSVVKSPVQCSIVCIYRPTAYALCYNIKIKVCYLFSWNRVTRKRTTSQKRHHSAAVNIWWDLEINLQQKFSRGDGPDTKAVQHKVLPNRYAPAGVGWISHRLNLQNFFAFSVGYYSSEPNEVFSIDSRFSSRIVGMQIFWFLRFSLTVGCKLFCR